MSQGSEDANPDLADVVRQFHSMGCEVIYQCRNTDLSLRDLQNLRADARAALVEIERAIQVATPIDLTRDPEPVCTCPPVKWTLGADFPTHMLNCPQFKRCTCYPSGRMNLSPADGHMTHCSWYRPAPT